jgi:hypothetical protein
MSSRKKLVYLVLVLTTIWALSAVNVFAQSQNEDKKPADDLSSQVVTETTTITTNSTSDPSTGAATVTAGTGIPPNPQVPVPPGIGIPRTVQLRQSAQESAKNLESYEKAIKEYDKVMKEYAKAIKDIDKTPKEDLQAQLQKAQESLQIARKVIEQSQKDILNQSGRRGVVIGGGYGRAAVGQLGAFGSGEGDVFGFGGGGGGTSGGGGSWGGPANRNSITGKMVFDSQNGSIIVTSPGSVNLVTSPETIALRDKEQKIVAEINDIAAQYFAKKDKVERTELKKKLEQLVTEQFNIRQQCRELQVKQLETELTNIRETIQKRTENREQIIKRHIAQMLHEQDNLEF